MQKVERSQAQKEVESWLDFKKVGEKKRESQEAQISALVDAIVEGDLVLNEDFTFVQTLKFPTSGEMPIKEFSFKPRLKLMEIHSQLEGVKASDADGRILAYAAALTGKAKQIIRSLDTEDYNVVQAIAIFFL